MIDKFIQLRGGEVVSDKNIMTLDEVNKLKLDLRIKMCDLKIWVHGFLVRVDERFIYIRFQRKAYNEIFTVERCLCKEELDFFIQEKRCRMLLESLSSTLDDDIWRWAHNKTDEDKLKCYEGEIKEL